MLMYFTYFIFSVFVVNYMGISLSVCWDESTAFLRMCGVWVCVCSKVDPHNKYIYIYPLVLFHLPNQNLHLPQNSPYHHFKPSC